MGKDSGIEWTHHTFNPWWGCVKVSDACTHCYAETWARRIGQTLWGLEAPRRFFGDNHWREPIRWNAEAAHVGERRRVFCSSMADVFEDRRDLDVHRERLWELIDATPMLNWLLLTKRTDRVEALAPWRDTWPANVWLGSTAESQKWADLRVARLECVRQGRVTDHRDGRTSRVRVPGTRAPADREVVTTDCCDPRHCRDCARARSHAGARGNGSKGDVEARLTLFGSASHGCGTSVPACTVCLFCFVMTATSISKKYGQI